MKTNIKKNLPVIIVAVIAVILFASIVTYKRTKENNAWESAIKMNRSTSYEDYIKLYPNGRYKIKADSLFENAFWKEVNDSNFIESYRNYKIKFPNGRFISNVDSIEHKWATVPNIKGRITVNNEIITFHNKDNYLIAESFNGNKTVQLLVYKSDMKKLHSKDNLWRFVWKSKEQMQLDNNFHKHKSLTILKTKNEALIVSEYHGEFKFEDFAYFVVKINSSGKIELDKDIESSFEDAEKKENSISITGMLRRIDYSIKNEKITKNIIRRSDMAPKGAVKALFRFDSGNFIMPINKNIYDLNVGQTIAFIPDNEATKIAFDKGDINIYTDMWHEDGSGVDTSESSKVWPGNSIKFDKAGEFHFLIFNDINPNNLIYQIDYRPNFTVNVSRPVSQSSSTTKSGQSISNSQTATNTQSSTSGGYHRSNRDYFMGESAVHEFLSRHSFVSNDGSRLSYSIGDLTITYNRGRLRFTNIEVRIYSQDVAVVSATDIGSGRTLRIKLNATYGSIVDMNDNSMSFQAVN
jgi:hypothetical protein